MFVNILIINICYRDNLDACKGTRRLLFFTLLAGAPSVGTFPYSINALLTKRCWFSVTLVWSPYVYSPWCARRKKRGMETPVLTNFKLRGIIRPSSSHQRLRYLKLRVRKYHATEFYRYCTTYRERMVKNPNSASNELNLKEKCWLHKNILQ